MGERLRQLLLGDWSRLIRDPIDLLRLSFLGGAVFFPLPESVRQAAAAALVFGARAANLPRPVDLMLCAGVALEVWGHTLGLYKNIEWFDKVAHFGLPLLVSPLAYITLSRLRVVPDLGERTERQHYVGIFLITFSVVTAFGATLWEIFEYVTDGLLGTSLSFGYADTIGDMIATASGSALGGVWLAVWSNRRWGTRRGSVDTGAEPAPAG